MKKKFDKDKFEREFKYAKEYMDKHNIKKEQLEQKLNELLIEKKKLEKEFEKQEIEDFYIGKINELADNYFGSSNNILEELEQLSTEEVEQKLKEEQGNYPKWLYLYYYKKAKELYAPIFSAFDNIAKDPVYFFTNLLDVLYLGFNVEIFICTKTFKNLKGFIFNLEEEFGFKNKMGIVLTPNAFKSVKTFINTLFHELAHRAYFIELHNNNEQTDRVSQEWYAYFMDKFLSYFHRANYDWLQPIFSKDLFEMANTLNNEEPSFLEEIYKSALNDIENGFLSLMKHDDTIYKKKVLKQMYAKAVKMIEIPRKYEVINCFLWFTNTRFAILHKMKVLDLETILETVFLTLILFSRRYETKYHSNKITVYNNWTITNAVGEIDEKEKTYIQNYCSIIQNSIKDE